MVTCKSCNPLKKEKIVEDAIQLKEKKYQVLRSLPMRLIMYAIMLPVAYITIPFVLAWAFFGNGKLVLPYLNKTKNESENKITNEA